MLIHLTSPINWGIVKTPSQKKEGILKNRYVMILDARFHERIKKIFIQSACNNFWHHGMPTCLYPDHRDNSLPGTTQYDLSKVVFMFLF
jgi:hypothetical protein